MGRYNHKKAGIKATAKDIRDWLQSRIPNSTNELKAAKWVADLGNESFEVREQATQELLKLNNLAIFELKKATKSKDVEVAKEQATALNKYPPMNQSPLKQQS